MDDAKLSTELQPRNKFQHAVVSQEDPDTIRVDSRLMICCRRADEMPIGTECRAANGSERDVRGSQPVCSERVN